MCTIGPKCCVWKKDVCRKRNTRTRNLRKKNCSCFFFFFFFCFLFTWVTTACSSKSSFHAFFLPLLLSGDGGCRGSRFVDTLLSIVLWQAGYDGLGSTELLTHLFRTLPSTAKISLLDFLYRDILEQLECSWMFGDTSENYRETRDNSCVIILKSRLNPVGHSARTR